MHAGADDEDVDKTLALTIGVITGVILLIVFISSLGKLFNKRGTCFHIIYTHTHTHTYTNFMYYDWVGLKRKKVRFRKIRETT